jgi:NUMOD4 motif
MAELKEEWKDMSDYFLEHENYEVSNTGFIRSKKTKNILYMSPNTSGYLEVNLWKNNIRRHIQVHNIVGRTWIPNPNNLPVLDHINPNNTNDNSISNLRWTTKKKNSWNRVLKPLPVIHRKNGDVYQIRLMENGASKSYGYFHVEALGKLRHDEAVLKRDPEYCQLYFPALSRLIYAYENNIPVRLFP